MTRAALAWRGYAVVALALALLGVGHWLWAVTVHAPVLYGEGAVAHAALLARDNVEYAGAATMGDANSVRPLFTAANYPPLYFSLAGIGDDPFVVGRIVSILATLFVAATIAWRARAAGWLVASVISLAWLGSVPVLQWGTALKPDLVALALTVGAVVALDARRPRHILAGALVALAVLAKPTAVLPALALFLFALRRDRGGALRGAAAGLAVIVVAFIVVRDLATNLAVIHIVSWNELPWRFDLFAPLLLLALLVLAVPIVAVLVTRPSTTAVTAYVVGAVGILLLGGREGATINYMLDLSAAIALAIAGRGPTLAARSLYPVASVVGLAVAVFLTNPFGIVPGRGPGPGAWGDPGRVAAVAQLAGTPLVEDSGVLLATGREPLVDDVFLWSRNRAREDAGDFSFLEGERVLAAVRAGTFDAVVSEVDLAQLDAIGGFERQRWHPDLVAAVLGTYPSRSMVAAGSQTLYIYRKP